MNRFYRFKELQKRNKVSINTIIVYTNLRNSVCIYVCIYLCITFFIDWEIHICIYIIYIIMQVNNIYIYLHCLCGLVYTFMSDVCMNACIY